MFMTTIHELLGPTLGEDVRDGALSKRRNEAFYLL